MHIRPLWILSVALCACHHAKDGADAAHGADKGTKAQATKTKAASGRSPDPGPVLTRGTGVREAEKRPALKVRGDAIQVGERATYLRVAMPAEMSSLVNGVLLNGRILVQGKRYGLAVPAGEGRMSDRPLLYIRLVGKAKVADRLELTWHQPASHEGAPGQVQKLTVVDITDAPEEVNVRTRFYQSAASWFQRRGHGEAFNAFAAGRMRLLGGKGLTRTAPGQRRTRRSDVGDLMSFYTGWTSVEEALQTDRGLRVPLDYDATRNVPLADVEAVKLPGHPWDEMIEAVGGKEKTKIEPLAAYAPHDALYLHFHDLRTLVRLASDLDKLVTPVTRVLEERPGARHFVRRYEHQLAIERLGLAKTLGHVAAKGVALVTSDPFFREGTDLTLLFHLNNAKVLEAALASYEQRTRARRPDVAVSTYKVGEHEVRLLGTADRDVHQHRLRLNDVLVLSNSRAAVERIIAAKAGTLMPLAQSGDYRYFRTRYPYDRKTEDGFGFVSDAFVQHVISPRVKVLQARRMSAMADLYAVGFSTLLHGWLEGKAAGGLEAAIAGGLLERAELKHDDGGEAITFDVETGARSAKWGRPAALRPLVEMSLTHVNERERGAYKRFRSTYQRYWRGFIDPISVRVRRTDKGVDLEAVMMPLIQLSDYNELERMVGRARIQPPELARGVRLTVALAKDSKLRGELDRMGRFATGSRDIGISWLGDWVMVGLGDRSGLWDLALSLGDIPTKEGRRAYADVERRKRVYDRVPVYAGAHVRDKLALAATLTALKGFVSSAAPGVAEWGEGASYRDVPTVVVREKLGETETQRGIGLHYAIVKDVFVLSLDRGTLEQQIDAVLEGKTPKPATKDAKGAEQSMLAIKPGGPKSWLSRTILGLLERGTVASTRSAYRAYEVLALGLRDTLPKDPAALERRAIAYLGFSPGVAHGGHFELKDGAVHHSLYGTEHAPAFPKLPIDGSPVTAFVAALDELRLTLSFEGEGTHRGLRSTLRWRR